jgi:hypothetical protein
LAKRQSFLINPEKAAVEEVCTCATIVPFTGSNWIKYKNLAGDTITENTGTKNFNKAQAMLEAKLARIEIGEYVAPKAQNITVNDIVEFSLNVAQGKGNRNPDKDRGIWEVNSGLSLGTYLLLH